MLVFRPLLGLFALLPLFVFGQEPSGDSSPPAGASVSVSDLLAQASAEQDLGDLDGAIQQASLAIQLDPHNALAFELRGSLYIQKKLWDRAERDYASADKIGPEGAYKFKLAGIKFLQFSYNDARVRFVRLQDDPQLGDIATYKVFLCDLLDRRESAAARDLASMDAEDKRPSYYYSHAAWALFHNNRAEANQWFTQAGERYDQSTSDLYIASLVEAQHFHATVVTFSTRDGQSYDKARAVLEPGGLNVSTGHGWVTVPIGNLPDDLSSFPDDLRLQIEKRRTHLFAGAPKVDEISFQTSSGKSFDHVRYALDDSGVSVLTPDGWVIVPFEQLPVDRSSFPADLQLAITEKQQESATRLSHSTKVSFTTRQGKTYMNVKASLMQDGVYILTPSGWMTVPFDDLPADLTVFPTDWRAEILDRTPSPFSDSDEMRVISFTTRKGKSYHQVRASLGSSELRLVTTQGLVGIPLDQLPVDLSAFPLSWQSLIAERQAILRKAQTPSPAPPPK